MNTELGVYDVIVVGSGVNGLACAALLAKAGRRVCVLERNDWFGGAIKTAEITKPGFHHDVFSAWHPLWVGGAAHARLGADLARHGLEYLNTEHPTATLFPDGEAAFLLRTADANVAELERFEPGDGAAWRAMLDAFFPNADLAFGVLGTELWSRHGAALALRAYRRLGRRGAAEFGAGLADLGARLADADIRLRTRSWTAGAMGPAHGARPGCGGVRLHGGGDRRRGAGGRHADAARRRRATRRRVSSLSSASRAVRARRGPRSRT